MTSGIKILVVDDEPQITEVLKTSFDSHGYEVQVADDGRTALEVFWRWRPNLVITDLSMPIMGGLALCQEIRSASDVPIIVLSVRDQEAAKVQILECGADDYVTKPFGMDELLARVRSALRRTSGLPFRSEVVELGDFVLDTTAHRVKIKGTQIHLTPKEFDLLSYLLRHAGRVLTHKMLLTAVWGRAFTDQPDTVRVLVRQLRRKIEPDPAIPTYLQTEPSIGYRFEPGK
jgi:two-component system, OmpR family, KDP operon response regulator KdpE